MTQDKKEQLCCKDTPVTKAEMIKIIKGKKFDDGDVRMCFWVYMDSKNGDKSIGAIKEISNVVKTMETHRPKAHALLLENFKKIKLLKP